MKEGGDQDPEAFVQSDVRNVSEKRNISYEIIFYIYQNIVRNVSEKKHFIRNHLLYLSKLLQECF